MSDTMPRELPPGNGGPRMPRGGRRLVPAIIAGALAIAVVVGVVVVLQSLKGGTSSPPTTASSSTPKPAAHVSTQEQRQAAVQLAGLLSQSGSDRGAVIDAVVSVQECAKTLPADEQTLTRAATNRDQLLSRLGNLTGRSALPAGMITDLTGAWQASAQADSDLAKWTADEISGGCHKKTVLNDPNYKASLGPDNQATNDKMSFTALWNPFARRYGQPAYQWNQI
jgi:hypothetical protein